MAVSEQSQNLVCALASPCGAQSGTATHGSQGGGDRSTNCRSRKCRQRDLHMDVSLRIYSIFGQFLCFVETGMFATREDLRYAAAHILDLDPVDVEMYMNDNQFLMSNTLTLWEQNVHQDTVLTLRRLGYEGL